MNLSVTLCQQSVLKFVFGLPDIGRSKNRGTPPPRKSLFHHQNPIIPHLRKSRRGSQTTRARGTQVMGCVVGELDYGLARPSDLDVAWRFRPRTHYCQNEIHKNLIHFLVSAHDRHLSMAMSHDRTAQMITSSEGGVGGGPLNSAGRRQGNFSGL